MEQIRKAYREYLQWKSTKAARKAAERREQARADSWKEYFKNGGQWENVI